MATERDAATLARIAERVGITPAQVRAVLAAPELEDDDSTSTSAAQQRTAGPIPATGDVAASPILATGGGDRARVPGARGGSGERVPAAAAWAAAGVALVAIFVFIATTGGFDTRPDGKIGALLTGLTFAAVAWRAAVAARARGFRLGEQLGWTVVAIISPVITWSVLWLLDLWPGRWVQESPVSPDGGYWASGTSEEVAAASLVVFLTPLIAALWALRRTGAELAVGVALLAAHAVLAALAVLAGIPAPGEELAALLVGVYVAVFGYAAHRLERRRRDWANWVHPFALVAAFWFVGLVGQAFGAVAGLTLGALLLIAGALLTVAYSRGMHLAATVLGGALWDFWLYDELSLGPVAGLALTLTLGLGAIALAVTAWRSRRAGGVRPSRREPGLSQSL